MERQGAQHGYGFGPFLVWGFQIKRLGFGVITGFKPEMQVALSRRHRNRTGVAYNSKGGGGLGPGFNFASATLR